MSLPRTERVHKVEWHDVTASSPCVICNEGGWCSRDAAGNYAICRRLDRHSVYGQGKAKTDSSGATYYVYRLAPPEERNGDCWPAPQFSLADGHGEKAHAGDLDKVYSKLLALLRLKPRHREALKLRGVDPAAMHERGYRTLDLDRAKAIQKLIAAGLEELLPRVPGFYVKDKNGRQFWSLHGRNGILCPVRDADGRIVALCVRLDEPDGKQKYAWLSSKKDGGAGPGAPCHVPPFDGDSRIARLTEGNLKAEIATVLGGLLTVGMSSHGRYKQASRLLRARGVETVRVALDADARTNPEVARSVAGAVRHLRDRGLVVELELWDLADCKGIDDLLSAGKEPEVITGEAIDRATAVIAESAAKAARARAEVKVAARPEADDDPHRLARIFLDEYRVPPPAGSVGTATLLLRSWQKEFWLWRQGAYRAVAAGDVQSRLVASAKHSLDEACARCRGQWLADHDDGDDPPAVRKVTTALIRDTTQAAASLALLSAEVQPPAWLGGGPEPRDLVICRNAIIDLPAFAAGRAGAIIPPTPDLFTLSAADIAFDAAAPEPVEWMKFLHSLWPDDAEARMCLQDWFGYTLTPDTSQQKILFIIGPTRSGKGTIARVLHGLLGDGNVAAPTLGSLGTNFGLWPLIGKTAAIISDARIGGRSDMAQITERLLSISGEDAQTIDRKNLPPITTRLYTRFVILANELPRITDASGALAKRFVVLRLRESFLGREDRELTAKLLRELPGILNWAIEGWSCLRQRGHFVQPRSAADDVEALEELASPIKAFVRDRCVVGKGCSVERKDLYTAWKQWCEENGRREPGDVSTFGRNLRAAFPTIESTQPRVDGTRPRLYVGLRLEDRVP
jgi:P4 family phage/plasmid primase-like protien